MAEKGVFTTDIGAVTAYADAKAHGYTGTRAEFGELLANAGKNLQAALDAKTNAAESASAAAASESNAKKSESNAQKYAASAEESKNNAASSANLAQQAALNNGYMQVGIDKKGHLIYTRTTNLKDKVTFSIKNGKNLEVTINA